jgi:DNA-binding SARP family transcriptional activator
MLEFRLLGNVEAYVDGRLVDIGHARQRCVLVALLIEANRPVPANLLLDRVWADRPPRRARNALSGYLSRLRRTFAGVDGIVFGRRSEGYVLTLEPDAVDLHRFHRLAGQARAADAGEAAAALFGQALGLWRGEAFATLDTPWLSARRSSLEAERLAAMLDRNDVALRLGRHADLLGELSRCAAEHPFHERLAAQYMLTLYRCGHQADALRHYESIRARLADELGADPGPDLRRLHHQILTADPVLTVGSQTSAQTHAAAPVPRQLPASPPFFVGRAREVAELDTVLADGRRAVTICVVWGTAGVGKTTLALYWAHRVTREFGDGQLYVNLRGFDVGGTATTPAEALRVFLETLGVPSHQVPSSVEAQSALYRSLLASRNMLVLLDNARDVEQIRPLLPGSPGCMVVVTSRNQLTALVAADGAHPLALDLLTHAEGRQLLVRRLGADRVNADPDAVDDIVVRCARLPLALAIVAARAATHVGPGLDKVAAELSYAGGRLEALADMEPTADVRTVFSWSYRALGPAAARLFRRLGLQPGPDIGLRAAASLADVPVVAARSQLAELARSHLITEHTPGRYAFHDLLRVYAGELARTVDDETEGRAATLRMLDHYLHTAYAAALAIYPHRHAIPLPSPPTGAHVEDIADLEHALVWFATEHAVLLTLVRYAARERFDSHAWQLAWTLTDYLDRHGRWHDQATVHTIALEAARRLGDASARASAHRALARASVQLGDGDDAIAHFRHALDLFGALDDRAGEAHTHLGLGWVLDRQDRVAEAIEHDRQALDLFRAIDHRLGQARSLNHLGMHHAQLGDHQRALIDCGTALVLYQEMGDRFGQAATYDSLGQAHHHLGHHDEAVACYQRAVDLLRDGHSHYYEAQALTHLGDAHHDVGRGGAAHRAWRRALNILKEIDHPDAAAVRAKLDA